MRAIPYERKLDGVNYPCLRADIRYEEASVAETMNAIVVLATGYELDYNILTKG